MDQPLICYKTDKTDDIKDYWSAQDQADILCLGLINNGVHWHIATAHYEHIPDYIASHRALLTTGHEARSILDAAANNHKLYGKTSAAIRDAIRDRTVSQG